MGSTSKTGSSSTSGPGEPGPGNGPAQPLRLYGSRSVRPHARDTLELERVYVSEAGLPLLEGEEWIEVASRPEPLCFDGDGNLISPFG